MTDAKSDIPSVVERTRPIKAGAPVVAAHFLGQTAVFVLGEEALLFVPNAGEPRTVAVHGGAILSLDRRSQPHRYRRGRWQGGVDRRAGREHRGRHRRQAPLDRPCGGRPERRRRVVGRQAGVRAQRQSPERMLEVPSTVGGLAFAPKGVRLAIAHYNGVTLWFANAQSEPETLEWKGSHLAARMSPDGRFVVTSMQESTLHGWRLADRKDMRMSGYSARVRSLDWTVGGKWLATSGSNQLILWPFQAKDGPMGKTPRILAPSEAQVEMVACHPRQEVVAVGYADGLVLLVRVDDGAEVLARRPGDAPVTALAWSATGNSLAFGTEDGDAGVIDLG